MWVSATEDDQHNRYWRVRPCDLLLRVVVWKGERYGDFVIHKEEAIS